MKTKIIAVLIAMVVLAGVGSAALLSHYGVIDNVVDVGQSVLIDGGNHLQVNIYGENIIAGSTVITGHTLYNRAEVPATIKLETGYLPDGEGITTTYWISEVLEDTQNMEKIWGGDPDLVELTGQLEVSISYEDSMAIFKATPPSDYPADDMTFTFDTDNDDVADFQIQYDEVAFGGWKYSEVNEDTMNWIKDETGWIDVPSEFIVEIDVREFTLKMPLSTLSIPTYKFGVQTNGEPGHQTFYSTDPAHLWYDASFGDYAHSTYYVPVTATEISGDITLEPGELLNFNIANNFNVALMPLEYTITTTVVPVFAPEP